MDPIAAFKKQQERNGVTAEVDKSNEQVRREHPRWSMIFDKWDTSKDGLLQLEEVTKGFSMVLGAGSEMPLHHMKQVFAEVDAESIGGLNFKQFCTFTRQVSMHMCNHPKWKRQEDALTAEEEKQQALIDRQTKASQEPDLFEILGLPRSKDIQELEERKNRAISNNSSARQRRLSMVASSIITGRRFVAALKQPKPPSGSLDVEPNFSAVPAMSAGSMTSACSEHDKRESVMLENKLAEQFERFTVSSPRMSASRKLGNPRQIHLDENLPQVRALGKRYAGCLQLRFSPDGSQLAGSFFDGGVRIFNVDKGSQAHCINMASFKGGTVRRTRSTSGDVGDGPLFGSEGSEFEEVEVDLQRVVKFWEPGTNLRWQPGSGKLNGLGTVDCSGLLSVWDIPRNKEPRQPQCIGQISTGTSLCAIAFTCHSANVAVGGDERIIKLYDIERAFGSTEFVGERQLGAGVSYNSQSKGHSLKIVSISAHPTQPSILVSVGLDRRILLWDVRAGGSLPVGAMHGPELAGDAVDIGKDGLSLLAGSHRSKQPIEIYDLRMTEEESKPVNSYEWCSNDAGSGGVTKYPTCQLFSAGWDECENTTIVAAGENENLARVFERPSDPEQPLQVIGTLRGKDQGFWSSAISADARSVAFGGCDGSVCILDVSQRRSHTK
jgi:WD40 repeat protein